MQEPKYTRVKKIPVPEILHHQAHIQESNTNSKMFNMSMVSQMASSIWPTDNAEDRR